MNLFGIGVTILYVLLIFYFRWSDFYTLKTMPLNEFGDFFAGVFGPLALFWLIMGYIQQQKELQQNTAALELQAKELNNSVEQYKELVKTTRQQLEVDQKLIELEHIKFKQAVEPNLILTQARWLSKGLNGVDYKFTIINSGKPASNIAFVTNPLVEEIFSHPILPFLGEGGQYTLGWSTKNPPEFLDFIIRFKDSNKQEYEKHFQLQLDIEQAYNIN